MSVYKINHITPEILAIYIYSRIQFWRVPPKKSGLPQVHSLLFFVQMISNNTPPPKKAWFHVHIFIEIAFSLLRSVSLNILFLLYLVLLKYRWIYLFVWMLTYFDPFHLRFKVLNPYCIYNNCLFVLLLSSINVIFQFFFKMQDKRRIISSW